MIERAHWSAAALGAIAMCCLLTAGCAGVKHARTAERVPTSVPAEAIVVAEPPAMSAPEAAAIPQPPVIAPAAAVPPVTAAPPVAAAEPPTSTPPAPKVATPRPPVVAAAPAPPALPKATTVPAPQVVPKASPVPVPRVVPKAAQVQAPVASQGTPAPLDLASLGTRLKQTRAIGVLTKLSLKNQVDDLLEKFRAYHRKQGTATLPELRRSYDMLMLKVLSLLQDGDPPLARDIVQSRAAIWGILADPRKFNEASLMAGATT